MLYCLNPACQKPQNEGTNNVCSNCGSNLLLGDRYRAIKVIGQGGFGKTYLASDRLKEQGILCVIKQFSFPSSCSTALRLFAEEAQRLKTLGSHPQIPSFIDYVEQENQYFIIQEYIDGSNLEAELAASGAFAENQIEQLLADILPVIQFVHEGGVIHRDIKPENIIRRSSDRKLSLVDFGAAKRATETSLAKTGTTIGSAGYAAPEQTFGKAVIQSDLYSLGVTCIHLLTGLHPFDLVDSASGEWAWRDYLKQPVNTKLGQIMDKLLERGTRQRYQSAAEVLQDLQSLTKAYAIAAKKLSNETRELYKQGSVEQLAVRRFDLWEITAIGAVLVVFGIILTPVVVNVLNQPQVAKIGQEQVRKAPAPQPMPVPQRPKQQYLEAQDDTVGTAYILAGFLVARNAFFLLFLYCVLLTLREYIRGEGNRFKVTITTAILMFAIASDILPSLLRLDVAIKYPSLRVTNDLVNQILPDR